ncbi:MAG TPA: maleylpyruvate isomerase N-terminal domain-containing protein [Mucilaginibacter sp.]
MDRIIPIKTIHLFPLLHDLLIDLLRSLEPADWQKRTIAPLWTVKDIAAHLLDVNMRTIATVNNYSGTSPQNINSYTDLVNYLNELNNVWVRAMDRVSPQQLIELMETTGRRHYQYLESLDPFAPAMFAVSWAGEEQSENWFHIAREYTEKWHHQQQIRDAVGKPGIMHYELFYPCMDTFMQAMPYTYRNTVAAENTVIQITISTPNGGTWYLHKQQAGWTLTKDTISGQPDASITITPDTAWKLFTKGMKPDIAMQSAYINGDESLARVMLGTIAVMA